MDPGTKLTRLALFGQPVKSSLSPAIHRMFAGQLGLEISYDLIETSPVDFPAALESFQLAGGAGCNITLPLKGDAYRLASGCSEQVGLAQAANTLIWQDSGWFAHTTDGAGMMTDLMSNHGVAITQKRVLVLGAGGAVAGILGSLLAVQPAQVVLVNRNVERARSLGERFGMVQEGSIISWADLPGAGFFDLIINATSIGHAGEIPPLPASVFTPDAVCYDLNYHHSCEPLKAWCEARGQRYIDGIGMLVEQAAASFEIWTGHKPDSGAVIKKIQVL